MAINKLYITPRKYKSLSDNKITSSNFEDIIKSDILLDYQTSLADCQSKNLDSIFNNAQIIEVHGFTGVESTENMIETNYEIMFLFNRLNLVKEKVIFTEFDPYQRYNYKDLIYKKSNLKPTLWVGGCSVSNGDGVKEKESYASLLADKLKYQLVNLSRSGESIFCTIDHLLRADIQPHDIVIFGVTNFARHEYVRDHKLIGSSFGVKGDNFKYLKYIDLEYFESEVNALKCCHQIFHIINVCNNIGARVIIANILDITLSPIFFKDCENYIDFSHTGTLDTFIDIGNDGLHPGPKQHQCYFDKIYQKLIDIYPNKSYNNE